MLYWLGENYRELWGPLRLLQSHLVLASLGAVFSAIATFWILRYRLALLPLDRGREHAAQSEVSKGKPTGAGMLFIPVLLIVCLLVVPWDPYQGVIYVAVFLAMLAGFLDDRSMTSWGEWKKGIFDVVICGVVAWALLRGQSNIEIWWPLYAPKMLGPEAALDGTLGLLAPTLISSTVYWGMATFLLFLSINTTNCTDGVDGLSGSLLAVAFLALGGVLYGVVGHVESARYLLVPFNEMGASWAIVVAAALGALVSYLWYNAHPSQLMMGDAGSRPLGLLLGIFSLETGNPILFFVVAFLIIANGGTGLLKLILIRVFSWRLIKVTCPLHDHFLKNHNWSPTQVLVRMVLMQAILTPLLLVVFLKIR
ncbi:MAG: hypothetical protein CBC13_03940 [Planctomycetia bacterium TMED53]|nr:MAG: hypothetical protein CBC13_03940 [Planctomycetia bacterium TMED53]